MGGGENHVLSCIGPPLGIKEQYKYKSACFHFLNLENKDRTINDGESPVFSNESSLQNSKKTVAQEVTEDVEPLLYQLLTPCMVG